MLRLETLTSDFIYDNDPPRYSVAYSAMLPFESVVSVWILAVSGHLGFLMTSYNYIYCDHRMIPLHHKTPGLPASEFCAALLWRTSGPYIRA